MIPRVAPNCPYYGLYKLRQLQQKGINTETRDDFILRSLALKDVIEFPEKLPNKMQQAIE
jgi:hypothetical protein